MYIDGDLIVEHISSLFLDRSAETTWGRVASHENNYGFATFRDPGTVCSTTSRAAGLWNGQYWPKFDVSLIRVWTIALNGANIKAFLQDCSMQLTSPNLTSFHVVGNTCHDNALFDAKRGINSTIVDTTCAMLWIKPVRCQNLVDSLSLDTCHPALFFVSKLNCSLSVNLQFVSKIDCSLSVNSQQFVSKFTVVWQAIQNSLSVHSLYLSPLSPTCHLYTRIIINGNDV